MRAALRARFQAVLVDEAQDLCALQHALIEALTAPDGALTLAGDDDQAIYGWRGADLTRLHAFERTYPGGTVLAVGRNYRSTPQIVTTAARLIAQGNVLGWFQGRMEFGPRALGGRSILADPRDPKMRDTLNMKIKFREGFRPFAPSVLADKAREWFDIDCESPYMLLVAQVREGKRVIPSVTHVDGSARLQTITRAESPLYYDLIEEFGRLTGVPVIINTSFNVRGEPIVCTPHDAYLCFRRTNMDHLVLGHFLLDKKEQPPLREDVDWRTQFELD